MDWSKVNEPAQRLDPPAPPRIATLFRLVGPSERPIRCATYRVATGEELRLEYEQPPDDVLKTQLFKHGQEEAIAEVASQWRATFDGRGFTELAILD
jgi:hypothetical protein